MALFPGLFRNPDAVDLFGRNHCRTGGVSVFAVQKRKEELAAAEIHVDLCSNDMGADGVFYVQRGKCYFSTFLFPVSGTGVDGSLYT